MVVQNMQRKAGKDAVSGAEQSEKVLQFESFLNERLRTDLKKTLDERDKVYESLSEYLQLKNVIKRLQDGGVQNGEIKTQVDLGCNFYVQAKVPDAKMMFVSIGYGFYLELTLQEALAFIAKKEKILNEQAQSLTGAASKIKAHIKLVLEGLREIQDMDGRPDQKPFRDVLS